MLSRHKDGTWDCAMMRNMFSSEWVGLHVFVIMGWASCFCHSGLGLMFFRVGWASCVSEWVGPHVFQSGLGFFVFMLGIILFHVLFRVGWAFFSRVGWACFLFRVGWACFLFRVG